MPDNIKNVIEEIQAILDKNNGLASVSKLASKLSKASRDRLGFKTGDSVKIMTKKLELAVSDKFIFRNKLRGNQQAVSYVLMPCDPADIVMKMLSAKPMTPKAIAVRVPFTMRDVASILNELIEAGKVRVEFVEALEVRVSASARRKVIVMPPDVPDDDGDYTQAKFRAAYDELHREREFVRICDMRKTLNWPRKVFDEMLVSLRNSMTVHLAQAEERYFTQDELANCWVDENNYRMGTVSWNVK